MSNSNQWFGKLNGSDEVLGVPLEPTIEQNSPEVEIHTRVEPGNLEFTPEQRPELEEYWEELDSPPTGTNIVDGLCKLY